MYSTVARNFSNQLVVTFSFLHVTVLPTSVILCNRAIIHVNYAFHSIASLIKPLFRRRNRSPQIQSTAQRKCGVQGAKNRIQSQLKRCVVFHLHRWPFGNSRLQFVRRRHGDDLNTAKIILYLNCCGPIPYPAGVAKRLRVVHQEPGALCIYTKNFNSLTLEQSAVGRIVFFGWSKPAISVLQTSERWRASQRRCCYDEWNKSRCSCWC